VIIGERSWGKGTVQNILEMEGGRSALKLTTATYWRPSGRNIHRHKDANDDEPWGVSPDEGFNVPLQDELLEKVFLQRRKRDRHHALEAGSDDKSLSDEEATVEDTDDPQLRRAIEHLEKELLEKDAMSQTA